MNLPDHNTVRLALEKAEAEARLASARTPDRFNEDWRFGRPHRYAEELVRLLEAPPVAPAGRVTLSAPSGVAEEMDDSLRDSELLMSTIGSDRLLALHLRHFGRGASLLIEGEIEEPIVITYETDSLFLPTTCIMAAPGARARVVERHLVRGEGVMFCTRTLQIMEGADISVELEECGSGASRTMNITNISVMDAHLRHLTTHAGHLWAREEALAEILRSEQGAEVRLCSANRLSGQQVLDQHTRQIHTCGGASSDLLYKNVVDDKATAIFAGNIRVEAGAHHTDAYQSNRNMLLSDNASVHSLPGLEILADHVRCSHGSASAPMDEEQLFYLLSRGIPRHEAQLLVADGFLADVLTRFREEGKKA